ncbi:MAG: ImmA/IrrE family metallo-endopeptidase [Candidatus Acidiferrales bacterium]
MTLSVGRTYAETLLERFGMNVRLDLYSVASRLGLSIEERDAEGFEGALVRPIGGRIGIIVLSRSIREIGRRNFTIAHEIGHYVLPGHDTEESVCLARDVESWGSRVDRRELDANEFAAEILIPTSLLRARASSTQPGIAILSDLAEEFSASLTATARRFVEVTTHRCAIVWSTKNKIVWYAKSETFGHHVKVGEVVDRNSLAYRCFSGAERQAGPLLIPADSWLPEHNLLADARIFEESLFLPFYESVLSLLWTTGRIEKRTEWDEEESEEALDPNEFTLARKRWPGK